MNNLYLIVGKSGCGKSTLAAGLVKEGYKLAKSFTTREKRTPDEDTYNFVNEEEFEAITDKLSVAEYAGDFYGISREELDNSDLYIVEPSGVHDVLSAYRGTGRSVFIIYVLMNKERRLDFLISRCKAEGKSIDESAEFCKKRLQADEELFAKLIDTVDYVVVNWSTQDELVQNALYFINHCESGSYTTYYS